MGVMLGVRHFPPRETFDGIEPNRILFDHSEGVFENATAALEDALDEARRRYPQALVENFATNADCWSER